VPLCLQIIVPGDDAIAVLDPETTELLAADGQYQPKKVSASRHGLDFCS
jgi:hypothetical protein